MCIQDARGTRAARHHQKPQEKGQRQGKGQKEEVKYVAACCRMLQCVVACCSALQCCAAWYSVVQCVAKKCAVCCKQMCSVLQTNVQGQRPRKGQHEQVKCVAEICSELQRVATCCSVLHCILACCCAL